jgi:hypothetical protein
MTYEIISSRVWRLATKPYDAISAKRNNYLPMRPLDAKAVLDGGVPAD